jgi:hypothetical protein
MLRARELLAAALLTLCSAAVAQAPGVVQAAPAPALAWLTGSWRGSGTMFGNRSEATLIVRPVLDGRFLEFSYRAGPFEGRAFYRAATDGAWQATWFDNRGVSFPIAGQVAGRVLISEWGSAATERGRTIYRLADDGRLHATDAVRRPDGSYSEFASHVLTRAR